MQEIQDNTLLNNSKSNQQPQNSTKSKHTDYINSEVNYLADQIDNINNNDKVTFEDIDEIVYNSPYYKF